MADDIVERLRTEKEYCEACNLYPCTKKVGMFDVDATPADCDCECHDLQRAAADEIERLRENCENLRRRLGLVPLVIEVDPKAVPNIVVKWREQSRPDGNTSKPGNALIALVAERDGYGMCCMHYECNETDGCSVCSAIVEGAKEIERLRARVARLEGGA